MVLFIVVAIATLLLLLWLQHDVLPLAGLVILELEVDLVDCTSRVKVYPEVAVVKDRLHREVRRVVYRVLATCRRLNKESLLDLSVALLKEHPTVQARMTERIVALKVRRVDVNRDCSQTILLH